MDAHPSRAAIPVRDRPQRTGHHPRRGLEFHACRSRLKATGPAGRSPKETHAQVMGTLEAPGERGTVCLAWLPFRCCPAPNRLRKNGFWQSEVSCPRGGDVLSGPESRFAVPGYGPEGDQRGAGRARQTLPGAVHPKQITQLERPEPSHTTPGSPSALGCRP